MNLPHSTKIVTGELDPTRADTISKNLLDNYPQVTFLEILNADHSLPHDIIQKEVTNF